MIVRLRSGCFVAAAAMCCLWLSSTAAKAGEQVWLTDYAQAVKTAKAEQKMLLILFHEPGENRPLQAFDEKTLTDEGVRQRLGNYVLARLSTDARAEIGKDEQREEIVVFKHPAFQFMEGRQGLTIIDYAHKGHEHFGHVVSAFPFPQGKYFTARKTSVILDLPPGTLTQRTLIYAVRMHPEAPQSTTGELSPVLALSAESHSRYQAEIQVQGHHNWDSRFHLINSQLPAGMASTEVCAESWPGEGLVEAAEDCVQSWRQSSGHWSQVSGRHRLFGYDMKRGRNGIWYATGIFGGLFR